MFRLLVLLFLICVGHAPAQTAGLDLSFSPSTLDLALDRIRSDSLQSYLSVLAGDDLEGRGAGYSGEVKATNYIADFFRQLGLKPAGDVVDGRPTYWQRFQFHPRRPLAPWTTLATRNVAALLEGTDPQLKHEIVVLGAHHDGQGRTGQADIGRRESITADGSDRIWNGANDNASGIASLLEIARTLLESDVRTRRSILFLTFGAEEHGLIGSLHYTSNPLFPWERHVGMINLEMIGRNPGRQLNVGATSTSPAWEELIETAEDISGLKVTTRLPEITRGTDHYGFAVNGVPAVHLGVHAPEDYHQVSDAPDKIAYDRLAQITRFGLALLVELANRPEPPAYTGAPGRDLGLTGISATPDELALAGLKGDQGGLKVTAVAAGLPAHRAGIRPGDLLTSIGGHTLRREEQSLRVLERAVERTPIDRPLEITLLRDGDRLHFRLYLQR